MSGLPAQLSLTAKQARFEFLSSKLVIQCSIEGITLICFRYIATFDEELIHFNTGRSKIDPQIRPTMHMQRLAKDFGVIKDGAWTWDDSPEYKRMAAIAESLGLLCGRIWTSLNDIYHVEYREGA
jgi:hypothetical protein